MKKRKFKKIMFNTGAFLFSAVVNLGVASFFLFLFMQGISSCNQSPKEDVHEKVLGGKHELRKFNVKTENSTVTHGSYFLLMGSYSSKEVSKTKVRFYFENYRGEYQFMELSLEDVNIKTDSTVTEPYVKFFWHARQSREESEWRVIYKQDVTGAVIYCKEEDFQPEININDLR